MICQTIKVFGRWKDRTSKAVTPIWLAIRLTTIITTAHKQKKRKVFCLPLLSKNICNYILISEEQYTPILMYNYHWWAYLARPKPMGLLVLNKNVCFAVASESFLLYLFLIYDIYYIMSITFFYFNKIFYNSYFRLPQVL